MLLKPNELADLKKMAASNLDAALFSAARIGSNLRMDFGNALKKATHVIEFESDMRKERMTISKEWDDDLEVRKMYAEYKHIAKNLREILECLNKE